jgi:hypothetical protein
VRRSHGARWLVVLVVFAVLLVAADRVALIVAERAAARTVQSAQHLDRTPTVSIAGFPFLTQLVAGRFAKVTASASELTVGDKGRTVRIAKVSADLHGVHVPSDLSSVRAETATASAVLTYPDLSATLGTPLAYGGASPDGVGRITAHRSVSVAGQQLSGSATAEVKITDGALTFVSPLISVDGAGSSTVPQPLTDALTAVFGEPVALTHLPFGLTVRSVRADAGGLRIDLAGSDLTFRRS